MAALHLLTPAGFKAGAAAAGIKSGRQPDVALLLCDVTATAAALFTSNKVCAAPVKIGRQCVAGGKLRGIVVNSGNANACTGKQGERDALAMCRLAAKVAGCEARLILPSSTGIIGQTLPMEKVRRGIERAGRSLGESAKHAAGFADAIMTTDTRRKSAAVRCKIGRESMTLAGVCKGSGMIGPRLIAAGRHATMLAYLTTDAKIAPPLLRRCLLAAAEQSFNAVTVDDHTSTNDTVAILASGFGAAVESPRAVKVFAAALDAVCQDLARQIAADGEGATKMVRINVHQAKSERMPR